jgi:hypothetical protein
VLETARLLAGEQANPYGIRIRRKVSDFGANHVIINTGG